MSANAKQRTYLYSSVAPILFVAVSLATSGANAAPCTGPGAPATTSTQCYTAVQIPGNPLRSFDISWVNPARGEYYLGDRSNAGIDIINTQTTPPTFQRTIGGFVGIKLTGAGTVNNNLSGPDGVTSHGIWLYAGDGDSTLKVIDLTAPTASAIKQSISTGGTTRLDEMALNPAGTSLIAANNAEDPPFATLFNANGDNATSNVTKIAKILVDPTIIPAGFGLSIEQPTWDPTTNRFYTSIPIIANNPTGCNYGQIPGAQVGWGPPQPAPITCHGGMLVVDPTTITPGTVTLGAYNKTTNTGVVPLNACSPNGATVGRHDVLMLACTPGNNPSDTTTLVINAKTHNYANIGGITGGDEVWFNAGDSRYYLGASKMKGGAVLGVIDDTSVLIESIPQSANSHSVAADSTNNRIFVPQVAPTSVVGAGGDGTTVGQGICGGTNGCVAVYNSGAL
jgi:hypothetical protein